jgi:hypothetical protein
MPVVFGAGSGCHRSKGRCEPVVEPDMAVSVRKAEGAVVLVGPRDMFVALMEMISFGRMTKFFLGVGLGSGRG